MLYVTLTESTSELAEGAESHGWSNYSSVCISAERSADEWIVSVKDNRLGIAAENHEMIFLPLKRFHGRDGTGIGLAVCRKIVEQHGGRIWVESRLGEASKFSFTLPRLED